MQNNLNAVMIVEDDYCIARDLAAAFTACGVKESLPVNSVEAAEKIWARQRLDLAVLDVKLGSTFVFPLVQKLIARGIPIMFATGCQRYAIPAEFAYILFVEKPYDAKLLASAATRLVTPLRAENKNRLLAHFPDSFMREIRPHLSRRSLRRGERLAPHAEQVWFPETALLTLELDLNVGCAVGLVGNDGVFGAASLLGSGPDAFLGVTHIPGDIIRLDKGVFCHALSRDESVKKSLIAYFHGLHAQTAQLLKAAATQLVPHRVAHWLVLCSDLLGPDLPLTQESVSTALNVRRAGVTQAMTYLVSEGLIETGRGHIYVPRGEELRAFARTKPAHSGSRFITKN